MRLREAKLKEDCAEVESMFGRTNSSVELGFSRAGGSEGLCFAFVRHSAACHEECIAGGGATFAKIISMGSIDEAGKRDMRFEGRESRKVWIGGDGVKWAAGQGWVASSTPKVNTPCACGPKVFGEFF